MLDSIVIVRPARPHSMLLAMLTMTKEMHSFLFSMHACDSVLIWLWCSALWPVGS